MRPNGFGKRIYWADAEKIRVDATEYAEILKQCREEGREATTKTCAWDWDSEGTVFKEDKKNDGCSLYVSKKASFGYDHFIYLLNNHKLVKDIKDDFYPSECRGVINKLFKKYNGCTLYKAYHTVDSRIYRNLVPKPTYYLIDKGWGKEHSHVQYADVSSMFPSCARGRLPDAKTAVQYEGRVRPTEEYPFAFYLNSHHCAEYGVFDTHDYLKLPKEYMRMQCFTQRGKRTISIYNNIKDYQDVTVLMKASDYEMTEVFEEINTWKAIPDLCALAKAISNKGLGTFHHNPEKQGKEYLMDYYHVAAIFIGRANAKQYAMVRKIEDEGGVILSLIVDSIIYRFHDQIGIPKKVLGEYYAEFSDVNFRTTNAINKYVLYDDDGNILKCVISGVENPIPINKPEDIDYYNKKEDEDDEEII